MELVLFPKWALGTKEILTGSLGRVELYPALHLCLVHPHTWGYLIWAAVQDGSSPGLLLILGCHLSVNLSAQCKILAFMGAEKWEPQLRSGSPGASPSPGGAWLCPTLCWYKRKLSRGGEGSGA